MKYFLCAFLALPTLLFARGNYSSSEVVASYNYFAPASIKEDKKIKQFSFSEKRLSFISNQKVHKYAFLNSEVGYKNYTMSFSKSGDNLFSQKTFDVALFKLGGATFLSHNLGLDANISLETDRKKPNLNSNAFYTGILHGAYMIFHRGHIHAGVQTQSGLHYQRVLPIIGIDYQISPKWLVNCIYPQGAALIYSYSRSISLTAALKNTFTRHRFSNSESGQYRDGFVSLRSLYADFSLTYAFAAKSALNFSVGQKLRTDLSLSDRHNSKKKHYRVKGAPLFGVMVNYTF